MSNIFDALQRSEIERSGVNLSALPAATELLERAERQATSKWVPAGAPERLDGMEDAERDALFGPLAMLPVASATEAPATAERSPTRNRVEAFGQFPSLQVSLSPESRLVCLTDKDSPAAEAFRLLGVRLRHLRRDRPLKKLLITSTIPQEGKSTIAANLACTLTLGTHPKVLLLEGDVRRPSLSKAFGLAKVPGLCECLDGQYTLATTIGRLENAGIWILPAGTPASNPLELLQSEKLPALMDQLTEWFDWIVIDSPPVLPIADTSVWTRLADGILLVMRQGTTQKRQLQRGMEVLEQSKLIGAVLNSAEISTHSDYYYRPRSDAAPVSGPTA